MKKRKWKLMKNQNLDREPETSPNQGKIWNLEMESGSKWTVPWKWTALSHSGRSLEPGPVWTRTVYFRLYPQKCTEIYSGKKLEKEHVTMMKIVKRENAKDQLSLIQKLQKSQKQKRTINWNKIWIHLSSVKNPNWRFVLFFMVPLMNGATLAF